MIYDSNTKTYSYDHPSEPIKVEIGDAKQAKFYPQVKLMRWDNESNLSVRFIADGDAASELVKDVVNCVVGGTDLSFYEEKSGVFTEGAHEFAVVLNQQPSSPVLSFSIRYKGLTFYYQPPLANENPDGSRWELNPWGGRHEQPVNVVGSYAAYYDKAGDFSRLGGKNYRAGKAFHLYRPWAEDSKGRRVWCELKIDELAQILTVILPKEFWASAAYPVVVDPTLGYTTQGGSTDTSTNTTVANVFTAGTTGDANPGTMHAYIKSSDGTDIGWKLAVYATSGGSPAGQAKLAQAAELRTTSTSYSDVSGAITLTGITSGTAYGVSRNGESAKAQIAYDAGLTAYYFNDAYGSASNGTFAASPSTAADVKHSVWVDYTASAAPETKKFTLLGVG